MLKKIILFCLMTSAMMASDWVDNINQITASANDKLLLTKDPTTGLVMDHLAVDAMIALWGYEHWHWGEKSFHVTREDWFEQDSDTGGSDKTGHFYMTYLLSRVLSARMEDRGLSLHEATMTGTLSAMLAMTLLEVGDGTSNYGFSKEDLLADGLGALSAYLIRSNPKVDDLIDIRLEYLPTSGYLDNTDAATDYSGMKHLMALKLSGVESIQETPLRYVEFQVGYYARGYRAYDINVAKSQQVYVGIGINLAELANDSGLNVLKNIFEFYQPGHTYIETKLWKR